MRLVLATQFRTQQPEMVHILAAHGTETCHHGTTRTKRFCGMASSFRSHHRFRHLGSRIVAPFNHSMERTAHTNGLVDGRASTAAYSSQHKSIWTKRIVNGSPTATARALGHSGLIAQ